MPQVREVTSLLHEHYPSDLVVGKGGEVDALSDIADMLSDGDVMGYGGVSDTYSAMGMASVGKGYLRGKPPQRRQLPPSRGAITHDTIVDASEYFHGEPTSILDPAPRRQGITENLARLSLHVARTPRSSCEAATTEQEHRQASQSATA